MNFKNFSVQYNNGSSFVDFTNVIGVNGESKTGINESTYSRDSAYYEFTPVTTTQIKITCSQTQVADAQKFLVGLVVTEEIGTFEGFPRVTPTMMRNETRAKALSGKSVIQKSFESNDINMTFKSHPYENDLKILETLFDSESTFLVYPCGGREGSQYFRMNQRGWTLKDIFNMQLRGKLKNEWEKGIYTLGFNKTVKFEEHV